MPNHIHGIVIINKTTEHRDAINRVSTSSIIKPISPGGKTGYKNPMLHDNLSRIIRWYKGRMTFECRKIEPGFLWQSRFYEHIIRNHGSYQRIAEYIRNNPANWQADKFFR